MKKIFTILLLVVTASSSFSQGNFVRDGENVSGQTLVVTTNNLTEEIYVHDLYYKSDSIESYKIKYSRDFVEIDSYDSIYNESLCYGGALGLCLPINSGMAQWFSSGTGNTVPVGDSVQIDYKVTGDTVVSCFLSRLYVLRATDGSKIDSVDISFEFGNCALGIQEEQLIKSSAYPNPAQDELFIKLNNSETQSSILLVDMLGKQVLSKNFSSNGKMKIDVSNLNNGVYFYSVISNGSVKETKKLIVKH